MNQQLNKSQFNKQAEKFASWSVGKNTTYLQAYLDFCEISPEEKMLDVACGPGDFITYASPKIKYAIGVDISDREIEIANIQKQELGIENVQFECSDVENLPFRDNSYTLVTCKSAFHHFSSPGIVLREMKRCCAISEKISVQDIVMFENSYVNDFFETFEKLVDISHNRMLNISEIKKLYAENKIEIAKEFKLDVDLPMNEYIEHAFQEQDKKNEIENMIREGIKDRKLKDYLFYKENELCFRRPVYLILGHKK
jgi:ubiquinone/menaquinone biosynthesis C-methylase UbiE